MSQKIRPTGIQVDRRQRQVFINWNDGTTCAYPFDGLRAVCPCVSCRGGHAYMGGPPDPNVVRLTPATDLTITNVVAVGG